MSGNATKGKKNGVGPSDDACMMVEPVIMNKAAQKAKGRKSKAQYFTSMEDEPMFSLNPIRSIPPETVIHDATMEVAPEIHNNYLPWVDYINVRELDNPRSSRVNIEDDDVEGENSYDEIEAEEKVFGEEVAPIVEERVNDFSIAEISEVADVLDQSVKPSVEDTIGKTVEPSVVLDKSAGDVGEDVPEEDGVDVSRADTEVIPEDAGQKKSSRKRKHKKSVDAGESSVPKKKLSKEEKATKKARKAERRARRVAHKATNVEAAEDDVPEEAEESVPEEVRSSVVQPAVDDEWLPEHEPQGPVLFDQAVQHAQSIAYPTMICSILQAQKEDILTADDTEGPPTRVITISPKLMEGTHVATVPLAPIAVEGASRSSIDETA
ncbi:hypothetical protein LIER_24180 [Lithospermum erythrorhizon]|uniref:Uncharacterized protein n=1 Tax=Lithospermum erythrorhizon TaxID=34254 RepID=A0AAV3R480_LITER